MWAAAAIFMFGGLVLAWEAFCRIDARRQQRRVATVQRMVAAAERDGLVAR